MHNLLVLSLWSIWKRKRRDKCIYLKQTWSVCVCVHNTAEVPFSFNSQSRPDIWTQRQLFTAFDLVFFLLKIDYRSCQMTHQQIIRDGPLRHKRLIWKKRGRWGYHVTVLRPTQRYSEAHTCNPLYKEQRTNIRCLQISLRYTNSLDCCMLWSATQ